ncbi:MAG: TPM domain-containing protein [Bacteroidales bacterium]
MKILSTVLFIFLFVIGSISAQDFPDPVPGKIIQDYANLIPDAREQQLERKLVEFNNSSSTQISIATMNDLGGYAASQYAPMLAEKWGIGQRGKDNGILILVKNKTSERDRGDVFIATGYGVEGAVPDAIAKRIVENEILPNFKNGNYYQGLDAATDVIMELTRGEYTAEEYAERTSQGNPFLGIVLIFLLIIFISSIFSRSRRQRHYSMGGNIPFWILLGMMGSSSRGRGSYGNFSSGRGSFGGGGGGFSGFGGGSFGGGGAGGSW